MCAHTCIIPLPFVTNLYYLNEMFPLVKWLWAFAYLMVKGTGPQAMHFSPNTYKLKKLISDWSFQQNQLAFWKGGLLMCWPGLLWLVFALANRWIRVVYQSTCSRINSQQFRWVLHPSPSKQPLMIFDYLQHTYVLKHM